MQFRLIYAGNWLKSGTGTKTMAWEKHALRKYFHDQLKALWKVHPVLSYYNTTRHSLGQDIWGPTLAEEIAHQYERSGIGCIPLTHKSNGLVCELDILFLRPGPPSAIIKHGGDIDNRLKTLLDSLRIPEDAGEMKQ